MTERTWTVAEIGRRIEQVVADRMATSFWVGGELADLKRTARGMAFFSLVQTDDRGRIVARLPGTMSSGKVRLADRRMARVGQPLQDGLQVRIRGHLQWFTPGGRLSLALDDIDPAHTAGAMALARRQLLEALQAEGRTARNATMPLARLPLRLGLVTRGGSQAYHDLTDELAATGLPFQVTLVSSGVQGIHAPRELTAAIRMLGARDDLDLVLLTRGGGADLDLSTFDDAGLARAVADCPLQVWTGIGHHTDTPVCEQVAARAFKTPTALAQGVIATVGQAVDATEAAYGGVTRAARHHLDRAGARLDLAGQRTQTARVVLRGAAGRLDADARRLHVAGRQAVGHHRRSLDRAVGRLRHVSTAGLSTARQRIDAHAGLIEAYDPARLLARGWSVTTDADGVLVTGPVPVGTRLRTTTRGGIIPSKVVDDD